MATKSFNARTGISVGTTPFELVDVNGNITLPAGTTTTAPLKFTSGTNLTSAVAGAVEWNGTNIFITQTSGPTRKTIAYTDSNITGTATTATNLAGGAVGQLAYQTGAGATGFVAVGNSGQLLQSAGSAIPVYTTATYPTTAGSAGKILRSDGTNILSTTSTFADTYGASTLLYANGANTVQGLTTGNNGVLVTNGSGVPSISTTLPAALSIPGALQTVSATVSAAGSTQGGATALTSDINIVTTVGSGQGVVLQTTAAGKTVIVVNKGANALLVYPAVSSAIDALSTNTGFSLAVGSWAMFNGVSTTLWYSTNNAAIATTALTGTITNAQLANSAVTIGSTSVSLGATVTTFAGVTLTTPVIDVINASSASLNPANLWSNITTGTIKIGDGVTTGTINIGTGTAGAKTIGIGTSTGTTTINGTTNLAAIAINSILKTDGSHNVAAASASDITGAIGSTAVTNATNATNLNAGGANTVVYQSSSGVTAYLTNGSTGQILIATTGSAPSWSATPTITTSFTVPLIQGTGSTGGTVTIRGGTDTTGTVALNAATVNSSVSTLALFGTPTTVNAFGAATAITMGATTGTTTINNSLVITGQLIVKGGSTITLNEGTLNIEDKILYLGAVASTSGLVGTSANGSAVVTGLTSTAGIIAGMVVTTSAGSLTLAGGTTVLSVDSLTQITLSVNFGGSGTSTTLVFSISGSSSNGSAVVTAMTTTAGLIPGMSVTVTSGALTLGATVINSIDSPTQITLSTNFGGSGTSTVLAFGGATDTTANGGGITIRGSSDKTILWDSTNSNFTSSENWNLVTGKVYKINNASVLSATTLGGAVVNSSLTNVGTLTALTVSGQITSTLSSGTAPFVVASTTQVANLNAATAGTATNVAGGAVGQLVYQTGAGASGFVAVGTSGQLLQSAGSAIPVYTTATYPSTASSTGTILRANGTNWVATTSTFADTYGVNKLLYASSANVVAGLTTAANGVLVTDGSSVPSISSTLPSGLSVSGLLASTSAAVSAAGSTQGGATAITSDVNIVTTVASNTGVLLPTAVAGKSMVVVNKGANALNVYPATSGFIDALSVNIPIVIPVGGWIEFVGSSSTQWYSTYNAALQVFTSAVAGVVPASGGGTTNFLRADGTWAVAGGGTVTSIAVTTANGVSGTSSGGSTPSLTITLGAITPSSVVASGGLTGTTLTVGSGTTTSTILTAGAMFIERAGALTTTSVSLVNLDTWAVATYRSAKYIIQVVDTVAGSIHYTEILVSVDNSNNVYISEYGTIVSGSNLVTFTADYDGSTNARLRITPASTNSTQFKFQAVVFNL